MRPHVGVIPLLIAIVVGVSALLSLPVDANLRRCQLTPDAPECKEPVTVPWIVRRITEGY